MSKMSASNSSRDLGSDEDNPATKLPESFSRIRRKNVPGEEIEHGSLEGRKKQSELTEKSIAKQVECIRISSALLSALTLDDVTEDGRIIVTKCVRDRIKKKGGMLLFHAAEKGEKRDSHFLIYYGADVNYCKGSKRAIDVAWQHKHYDIVLMLLKADSDFPRSFNLKQVKGEDQELLKLFVESRCRLHQHIKAGDYEQVTQYVINNRSSYYLNSNGVSALSQAVESEQYVIYAFLRFKNVVFKNESESVCLDKLKVHKNRIKYKTEIEKFYCSIPNAHILYLKSKSKSFGPVEDFEKRVEGFYRKLDEIPVTSSILKVIQYCDSLRINFDFAKANVTDINPTQSSCVAGCVNIKTGEIDLGAKIDPGDESGEAKFLGTLAHELAHLAIEMVYENDSKPYKDNKDMESNYAHIVNNIKNMDDFNSVKFDEIFTRMFVYKLENWHSELIVRVPQMYATYGNINGKKFLSNQVPELLEYYENTVMSDFEEFINQNFLIKPKSNIKLLNQYPRQFDDILNSGIQLEQSIQLDAFLGSKEEKIMRLSTENTWLTSFNVYQALQQTHNYLSLDTYLFFESDCYLKQQKEVNHAALNICNLLVIRCLSNSEESELFSILNAVVNFLYLASTKKVIFILSKDEIQSFENAARRIKKLSDKKILKMFDEVTLCDLTSMAQSKLFCREITFQGRKINLNELINEWNIGEKGLVRSEVLVNLITSKEVTIGTPPITISDLKAAYIQIYKDILLSNFIHKLCNEQDICSMYMICGTDYQSKDIRKMQCEFLRNLQLDCCSKQLNMIRKFLELEREATIVKKLVFVSSQDEEEQESNFKHLCGEHHEKTIYWMEVSFRHARLLQLYNPKFYMKRKFHHYEKIFIKKNLKEELTKRSAEFIFSGVDEQGFKRLLEIPENNCDYRYIIKDTEKEVEKYFTDRTHHYMPIYWIQVEKLPFEEFLIWKRSCGSLDTLRKYIDEENTKKFSSSGLLDEEEFLCTVKDNKTMLITDEAGMGKSTTLTMLSRKKLDSNWVMYFNLRHCQKAIQHLPLNITFASAVKFMLEANETGLDGVLSKALVEYKLKYRCSVKPLLLVFDEFDEINDIEKEKIVLLLKFLKDRSKAKVWVTARDFETKTLENCLSIFKTKFKIFGQEDQKNYLKMFWQVRLSMVLSQPELIEVFGSPSNKTTKFEIYYDLLTKLTTPVLKGDIHFMGTPLTLRLLAEGFETKFKAFIHSGNDNVCDYDNLNLFAIYQYFVHEKYNIYFEKRKVSMGNSVPQKWVAKELTSKHRSIAFKDLFPDISEGFFNHKPHWLKSVLSIDDRELKELFHVGIVQSSKNDDFKFVHQTFTEYFVADFLSSLLKKSEDCCVKFTSIEAFLFNEILLKPNFNVVRLFFNDCLIGKNLSDEILKFFGQRIAELWSRDEPTTYFNSKRPLYLHIAVQEGLTKIIELFLGALKHNQEKLASLITARDGKYKTAIYLAVQEALVHDEVRNKYNSIVKQFLNIISDISISIRQRLILSTVVKSINDENNKVIDYLLKCIEVHDDWPHMKSVSDEIKGKWKLMKDFLELARNGNISELKTLLQFASSDAQEYLLLACDENGRTALHTAAYKGHWQLVKWLLHIDVNVKNECVLIVLYEAILQGEVKVVKCLTTTESLSAKVNVGVKDNMGRTLLHEAASKGQLKIVNWLMMSPPHGGDLNLNSKCDNGQTAVHEAAINGHWKLVKHLVKYGTSFEEIDGWDIIDISIASHQWKLVKWLVNECLAEDIESNVISKVLHEVAYEGLKLLNYVYIKLCANVVLNIVSKSWIRNAPVADVLVFVILIILALYIFFVPREHIASTCSSKGQYRLIKWLIMKISPAVINEKGRHDMTFIHKLAYKGHWKLVRQLVDEKGADVNITDKFGWAVLHIAALRGCLKIVKWLATPKFEGGGGSDLNIQDYYGRTALHVAVLKGRKKIEELLILKGIDITLRDKEGKPAL